MAAPTRGARSNCAEGLYLELLEDSRRGRVDPTAQHAAANAIQQACQEFPEDLILGCWRYLVVIAKETGAGPGPLARQVAEQCQGPSWRQMACWEGVGEALTGEGPGPDAAQRLALSVSICDSAPNADFRINCIQRSINNVIPTQGTDTEIVALCNEVTSDVRDIACAAAFKYRDFITGKDGT